VEYAMSGYTGDPEKWDVVDSANTSWCLCGASVSWRGDEPEPTEWREAHANCAPEPIDWAAAGAGEVLDAARDPEAEQHMAQVMAGEEPETDELRAQRARERDEICITERPLHEFFTRRVADWWQRKDRSKYPPHTGMSQQILAQWPGASRSQVRDAVRRYLKDLEVRAAVAAAVDAAGIKERLNGEG
jgi:hypothetical protein